MTEKYLLSTPIIFDIGKTTLDLLEIYTKETNIHIGKICYDEGYACINFNENISFIDKDAKEISDKNVLYIHLENLSLQNIEKLMLYIVKNCNTIWDLFYYSSLSSEILLSNMKNTEDKKIQAENEIKDFFTILDKKAYKENICFKESFFTTGADKPLRLYWLIVDEDENQLGSLEYLKDKNAIQIYLENLFITDNTTFSKTKDVMFVIKNKNSKALKDYIINNIKSLVDLFILNMYTKPFTEKSIKEFYTDWHDSEYFENYRAVDYYKPITFIKHKTEGKTYNEQFADVYQDNRKIAVLSYSDKSVCLNFTNTLYKSIIFKSADAMNLMNWWAVSADRLQDFLYTGGKDKNGIPYQKEFEFFKKVNHTDSLAK